MAMKLSPDVTFYKDIHLFLYRPLGLVNEASVNRVIAILEELEFSLKEPFNRLSDTVEPDAIELNFEYIIRVSLYRREVYRSGPPIKSAILATERPAGVALGKFCCQLNSLRFAARERCCMLTERNVSKTHLIQRLDLSQDLGLIFKKGNCFLNCHVENVGDGLSFESNL